MTYPSDPNQPAYPTADYPTAYPVPPVNTPKRKRPRLLHVIGYVATAGVFLGIGIGAGGGTTPAGGTVALPAPTVTVTTHDLAAPATAPAVVVKPTPTPKPKPAPVKAVIPDGYSAVVGVDAPPGHYEAHSTDDTCYWEIDKHGTSDIVDNDLGKQGHIVITLRRGEDFSSERCGDWTQQ